MSRAYDLQRFRILLVEDNAYVRIILENVLRQLGIGQVVTACDGVEAIEALKDIDGIYSNNKSRFDLIISDMIMSPIDGLLLVKWVRESKDSPNRFLPFIMMSGAAEHENVRKARDHGINEFLAKPFSAQSVCDRILEVIDRPRQFVATTTYFGPDRQRRRLDVRHQERRAVGEENATVVYSSDKVVRPKRAEQIFFFRLPNHLQEKAGGGSGEGRGSLPVEVLSEADNLLERKSAEFHDWALDYLGMMSKCCDKALQAQLHNRRKPFERINELAHELRGQGGTFGYPLITSVGKMLYEITGASCSTDDLAVDIVKAHIDTMRAVFKGKIKGDGGEVGRAVLDSMKQVIGRLGSEPSGYVDDHALNQSETA
jgi:CheY-like chemotaxis protein